MLTTERVHLRPWYGTDAALLRAITKKRSVMRHVGGGRFWTDARVLEFITRQQRHVRALGSCLWHSSHSTRPKSPVTSVYSPSATPGRSRSVGCSTSPTGDRDWRLRPPLARCATAFSRSAWNG